MEKKANVPNMLAVENFMGSIDSSEPIELHFTCLEADAKEYGWNMATVVAIKARLRVIYNRKRRKAERKEEEGR